MLRRTLPTPFVATSLSRMKIIVGVKRVVDYTVKVRVKDNTIQTDGLKMSMNPFDEIAIEEAIQLKEKKIATQVNVVTIGRKKAEEVLRTALALGCDEAIHIVTPETEAEGLEPLAVAKVFQKLHEEIKPDMWILGKQAVDGDLGTTAQLLAGLLEIPQGTFASKLEVSDKRVRVTREVDAGHQLVELQMPCVVTADLRLNTPRFPKLPNIMKARKKTIDTRDIATFAVDITPHLNKISVTEPSSRKAGIIVSSVDEFYDKLHNEAKVF